MAVRSRYSQSMLAMLVVPFLSAGTALADTYRWRDAAGRDHFGSNPPPGALDVTALKGKKFSRYSGEKLIRPYQRYLQKKEALLGVDESLEADSRASLSHDEKQKKTAAKTSIKEADIPQDEYNLKNGIAADQPILTTNDEGEVIKCQVLVKNRSSIPATGVTVRFEFEDGSLIPAVGPQTIPPQGQSSYEIPEEVLPVKVLPKAGRNSGDPEFEVEAAAGARELAPPKVVVKLGLE